MNEPIEKEKAEIKKETSNPDFICTIMQTYFDEVIKTPCNHYFEKEAFLRWESEQKNTNGPETIASCPNCKGSVPHFELDTEMKAKVDSFLYNNLSQLPLRHVPEEILKRFLSLITNLETDRSEALKIFSDHPHLIFYCGKESMIKKIFSLPIDYLKSIFSELEKVPHLAEFALTWLNPSKNSGVFYSFFVGDIEKFEYIKSFVKDDQLYYAVLNGLEAAATTLNDQFFNHILMFLGDKAKNLIPKLIPNNGMNTLMAVCYRGTQGMIESILALFKDDPNEIIMNLISNSRYPDIFSLIMLNNSSQSQANIFAIYKSMNAFLIQKLGPEDAKLFKEFMENKRQQLIFTSLNQSVKNQERNILTIYQRVENLNARPVQPYPLFFQQAPVPMSPTINSTQPVDSQNSETTPSPVAPVPNASNTTPIVIGPIPLTTVHTPGNEDDDDQEVHVGCKQQ